MSDHQDEQIAQLRRFLAREKAGTAPAPSTRNPTVRTSAASSGASTQKRHLQLLFNKGDADFHDARKAMSGILRTGRASEDDWMDALRGMLGAFDGAMVLAKANGEDLDAALRRVRELEDQLGGRAVKERQRSEAEALVASGAVRVVGAAKHFVLAKVKSADTEYEVGRREKVWRCDCDAIGDCVHRRAVQLVVYPCQPKAATSRDGAEALASAGAVTISLEGLEHGLAEVIDGEKSYSVSRQGLGGGTCTCGAPNGDCVHAAAVAFLTRGSS